MKKLIYNIIINQLLIVALIFLITKNLTLLEYINYSFYFGVFYLFIGGAILIVRSGFFDFFTNSMKKVLSADNVKKEIVNMRPPSEAVSVKPNFFFISGLPIMFFMIVALLFYSI
ncbi:MULTISPECIES: DUF3899 domain-containing protein [Sporosarcina]|uniref:DUF3899 domain-containing protein n=1 Tax=Sporosarcina contaminans TaxID=633403 RepID=A0ABW3TVR6_9BACL